VSTTLRLFQLLLPRVQLYYALTRGTYLARRLDSECGISLYHCEDEGRGFFVEVGIDDGRGQAVVVRSFVSSGPLEEYTQGVQLPSV
jgi:hypothetical protein